jgi:hypothetical protein
MRESHPLVGWIVSFRCFETEESFRPAGRGRVLAAFPLLVEIIPRPGDDEPPHSIVISSFEPELRFHKTLAEEEAWFSWIMEGNERPDPVVKLVPKAST